ncbi:hypothetical protein IP91_04547 [Pseudoduganella lurida]|uniref:PEP-CTERM sorting domain-containing protein n=1 Tax=Pseudoduganella lurida TaxID=1036180 RepID=A0A562QXG1_9BURK|nr:hypothetical protein [Pseudoduganella lurida]TWI61467.1 hypothetical protein IP91_04547 [Pseudoduganella lurida]
MKRVLITVTAALALHAAPVFARNVPTFAMPASALAVAFSANVAMGQFDAGTRLTAAPHQVFATAAATPAWAGNAEARTGTAALAGTKPPRAAEISAPMLLGAGAVVLLLSRRRRVDNAVR